MDKLKIGFIGQGFVGKNLADNFVERGFDACRYSLEPEFIKNKEEIKNCDIVFIAVPTPTTPNGFDDSILRQEVKLVGKGKTLVIKSTILPGSTASLQAENPEIIILHSPEFLREVSAVDDTRNPERNLIGIPHESEVHQKQAQVLLSILPRAPYERILTSNETEMIKYVGNNFLYTKVVFMNLMFDLAQMMGADWSRVSEAVSQDSRIGKSHMNPVHASGVSDELGRGAGGHCFPKDFEALLGLYKEKIDDKEGQLVLESIRNKNVKLLKNSKKNTDLLEGIYGNI